MWECHKYFGCIVLAHMQMDIINLNQVAKELMLSGERRSELYPDIQTYADIIETQEYYF